MGLVWSHHGQAPRFRSSPDPSLEGGGFELSVPRKTATVRDLLLAYERRCALTRERTLPILDAAHIRAYAAGDDHEIKNGLLLRTDIHRLFDLGYVTVSTDGLFEVGKRLKDDFENGKHY